MPEKYYHVGLATDSLCRSGKLHSTRCQPKSEEQCSPADSHAGQPKWPQRAGEGWRQTHAELYATTPTSGPRSPTQDLWAPQAAWICTDCTPRSPRTLVPAPPIKGNPLRNPEGLRRGTCRRPARIPQEATPARGECPKIAPGTMHPRGMWMRVANSLPFLATDSTTLVDLQFVDGCPCAY